MAYALPKLLHLLSVVVWVGGMAFALFFLRPALAVVDPPQRLHLMRAVLGRFLDAVAVAIVVIVVSGAVMIDQAAARGGAAWPPAWTVMIGAGVVMIMIYGHLRFGSYRRLAAAVESADVAAGVAALASIRRWVGVNLAIGVAVIAVMRLG